MTAAIIAAAAALRLLLALCSRGTNDIDSWEGFAVQVREHGVLWMYANVPLWNHPPLMGYLAGSLHALASSLGWRFAPTFKLAAIAGDVLTLPLLSTVWSQRTGEPRRALWALTIFALSLDAILVSGYHGNTDPLVGAFVLAACVAGERRRYFWAGVLLGLAINVKLIPLLLAPLLVARATPRELARFSGGAALALLPFVPVLWLAGHAFVTNAVAYRSNFDNWGFPLVIRTASFFGRKFELNTVTDAMLRVRDIYTAVGIYLIAAAVLAVAALSRWLRPLSIYERAAAGLALFLLLTPGFGVQYTAILGPVILASSLSAGLGWALLSGLFIASVYVVFWTGAWPLHSQFTTTFPAPAAAVGVLAWGFLAVFTAGTLRRRAPDGAAAPS